MGFQMQVQGISDDPLTAIERLVRVPMKKPSIVQEQDVLIEIRTASISWVDIMMMCGVYQHKPNLPYTAGLEYSGVVVGLGKEAETSFSVGDRVFIDGFYVGPRSSGAYQKYGGFASYAVAPASAVHPMPPSFGFEEACNFVGNYETAYHALVHCGSVKSGDVVLINGASGATGLAAVHIAKAVGATVIATGRNPEKLALVKEQGADFVLALERNADQSFSFKDQVRALNGGRGVDMVYDGVGGAVIEHSLRSLRFGGKYLVVGWASTPFVSTRKSGPKTNQIPSNLVLMKGLQVLGSPAVISAQKQPHIREKRQRDLKQWVAEGKLRPFCHKIYLAKDIKEALMAKWNGEIVGGVAIDFENWS